jgi:hypothetical protein
MCKSQPLRWVIKYIPVKLVTMHCHASFIYSTGSNPSSTTYYLVCARWTLLSAPLLDYQMTSVSFEGWRHGSVVACLLTLSEAMSLILSTGGKKNSLGPLRSYHSCPLKDPGRSAKGGLMGGRSECLFPQLLFDKALTVSLTKVWGSIHARCKLQLASHTVSEFCWLLLSSSIQAEGW